MKQRTLNGPPLTDQEVAKRLLKIYEALGVFEDDEEQGQRHKQNGYPATAGKHQAEQPS